MKKYKQAYVIIPKLIAPSTRVILNFENLTPKIFRFAPRRGGSRSEITARLRNRESLLIEPTLESGNERESEKTMAGKHKKRGEKETTMVKGGCRTKSKVGAKKKKKRERKGTR